MAVAAATATLAAGLAVAPSGAAPSDPSEPTVARGGPPASSSSTTTTTATTTPRGIAGRVTVDGRAVRRASVRLFRAGKRAGHARRLAVVRTDSRGRFTLPVSQRTRGSLYVTTSGGRLGGGGASREAAGSRRLPGTLVLATALGDKRSGPIVVNEKTTVAAGFALAQFAEGGAVGGADPGLSNAMLMTRNLVRVKTGRTAGFLRKAPNGTKTQTLPSFNALAGIITGCATGESSCRAFLKASKDEWGHRPRSTWQAMTLIPHNPSGDPQGIFDQIPDSPPFTPVLDSAPAAWVIALKFVGNGHEFNGPGNLAFDENGIVWANNNAEWAVKLKNVCAGLEIFKLDPFSPGQPVEAYYGGGLNGAGFAISFDPDDHLWVANFGFSGTKCPTPPTSNSISEFRSDGTPVSPEKGYRQGPLDWPQGAKSDRDGNIWIANCGNSTVVRYPDGNPRKSEVLATGVGRAFDVAFNTKGSAFVTANEGDKIYGFKPNGKPMKGSPFGDSSIVQNPMGAASDRVGYTWVSNSVVIPSPCKSGQSFPETPDNESTIDGSVVRVGPRGGLTRYTGAGLTIPWGIAVDGDDNVWVANFTGQRVSRLCGARAKTCPTGTSGDPISPDGTGYPFDGLQRNTAVQIDPSGNVWLTNNWKKIPLQVNPFGDGLVAYLGMAPPVKAPLIGPPQRP